MTSARRTGIVWGLIGMCMAVATDAAAQGGAAPEIPDPTALEHALVDFLCRTAQPAPTPGTDASLLCYNTHLVALRTDFGRDLARLTSAERKTLDAACGEIRERQGRDAYLGCLNGQLTTVRARRNRGHAAAPAAIAEMPLAEAAPAPPPQPAAPPTTSSAAWWIGGTLVAVVAGAAGAVVARKSRRTRRQCRTCGQPVDGTGDLCAACRRDAAEAVRRAAQERADQAQAQQEQLRRQAELEERQRIEQAQRDEQMQLRQQEEERQRQEKERARQDEEAARARRQAAEASEDRFDPYAVLGLAPDAVPDAIQAAYEQARTKYDPAEVSHLGVELQEHYKKKALAVERAYQMLTTGA
jgi:hypothetical protein